jgi:hypothetical protein
MTITNFAFPFRWSLGALFAVFTLIAIVLGAYSRGIRHQAQLVTIVRSAGAVPIYDYQVGGPMHRSEPSAPAWIVDLIGIDAIHTVDAIEFLSAREPLGPEILDALCECRTLKLIGLRPGEPDEVVERLRQALPNAHICHRPAWTDEEWAEYHRTHRPD